MKVDNYGSSVSLPLDVCAVRASMEVARHTGKASRLLESESESDSLKCVTGMELGRNIKVGVAGAGGVSGGDRMVGCGNDFG